MAHNRAWSNRTGYAKENGGTWNFLLDEGGLALPNDPGFWDALLASGKAWGLTTYEQDWMHTQTQYRSPCMLEPSVSPQGNALARF